MNFDPRAPRGHHPEHEHAPHAPGRRKPRAPRWLLLPLFLLLLVLFAVPWRQVDELGWHDRGDGGAMTNAPVAYGGQVWVPAGPALLLPDRQMREVGEAAGGGRLYAAPVLPGGGGGLADARTGEQRYVRVGQDQYQPVMLVNVGRGAVGKPSED